MKKMISMLLVLAMALSLAACGNTNAPAAEAQSLTGTMEELTNKIAELQPAEFMGGTMPIDVTDTSEDGLWFLSSNTGLASADAVTDAATYGPMIGSIPFCMSLVRVKEGADVAAVAGEMKANIDTRKWVCVEADDLQVVSFGDVVMLIMVGSDTGLTSQSYVDAFQKVCAEQFSGAEVTVH